ncbi:MAG: hypothetical protein KBC81_02400 [Candidatus Pacebacteria bacterium]|nr:hypothetical protein [Candidatus Paceibacterota bacterium]
MKAKGGDGDTPKKVSTLVDRVRRRKRDALRKHRVSKANTPNGTNLHDIAEEPLDDILADSGGGGLTISLTITAGPSRHLSVDDGSSGDSGLPSKD